MIMLETDTKSIKQAHIYFRNMYECNVFKNILEERGIEIPWKTPPVSYSDRYPPKMTEAESKFYETHTTGESIADALMDWAYAFMTIINPGVNGYQRDMKEMIERRNNNG